MERRLRRHLQRLIIGALASLAVAAVAAAQGYRSFAGMTAAWAIINLLIVAASWKPKKAPIYSTFREFLALNLGLNAGYVGVGVTMMLMATVSDVRESGFAVVLQGLLLLILDGRLFCELGKEKPV